MIRNEDISVVIQGPVFSEEESTKKCCRSIRKVLPGAEIIFSTWENENVEGLDFDVLIRNADPGPDEGDTRNLKRQIVSTYYGVLSSKRKYVLKMRSESIVTSRAFVDELEKWPLHGTTNHFLLDRLVVVNTKPARVRRDMFHIIDWYFFGLKEDVLKFWDIKYLDNMHTLQDKTQIGYNEHRFLFTQFVKQHIPLNYYTLADVNRNMAELHNNIVAENFIIMVGVKEYGVESLKYRPLPDNFDAKMRSIYRGYTKPEWIKYYNKYCGGKVKVTFSVAEWLCMHIIAPTYILFKYEGGLSTLKGRALLPIKSWIKRNIYGK